MKTMLVALLALFASPAQDATDAEGFIRNWLVLAPIPVEEGNAATDLDKEFVKDEGKLHPKAGDKVKIEGKDLAWTAHKTADFYMSQKRLATEHPIFEDTGTGEPVRESGGAEGRLLASLSLVRLGGAGSAALDPAKRELLARKENIEGQIDNLKYQKAAMQPQIYDRQLKALLLDLSRVQAELDK